jgi:hypothetical protein
LIHGLTKIELQTLHVAIFKTQGLKFTQLPKAKEITNAMNISPRPDEKMRDLG